MIKLINFSTPVSIFKEGDVYVAYTQTLDISTCADSIKEVKEQFGKLVKLFFEELEKKNTTEEVLEDLGWQKIRQSWRAPIEVEHQVENFRVPVRV